MHTRTLSLTRTWTSRSVKGRQPDWALAISRAPATAPGVRSSTSGSRTPVVHTPGDLEGGGVPIVPEENVNAISLRHLEHRKSRPGTPRVGFGIGSQVTFALDSPQVPGTPRKEHESVQEKEAATDRNILDDEERHVRIKDEEGKEEIVGYGYASLHDEHENDASLAREVDEPERANSGRECGDRLEQIEFPQ